MKYRTGEVRNIGRVLCLKIINILIMIMLYFSILVATCVCIYKSTKI